MFGSTPGVIQTSVGYAGGKKKHPTYHNLGDHTEVVRINYDPCKIDYKQLLSIFWKNHKPSMTYQKQYWSLIIFIDEEQKMLAQDFLHHFTKDSFDPIHTKLIPYNDFVSAESYHQKYTLQIHPWVIVAINVRSAKELEDSQVCTKLNGFLSGYGTLDELSEAAKTFSLSKDMVEYVSTEMLKTTIVNR